MDDILLARQPILDRDLKLAGYELLFRDNTTPGNTTNPNTAAEQATATVLAHAFTNLNIETINGGHPLFVNFDRASLMAEYHLSLPPQSIVIEIVGDTEVDHDLINVIQQAHRKGYRFALDNFSLQPERLPLLSISDYMKIDVLKTPQPRLLQLLNLIKYEPAKLIAVKVETMQSLEWCLQQNFQYFQGFFFEKPCMIQGQSIPGNKMAQLALLTKLNDPEVNIDEIVDAISQDPGFVYRMLRIINSAAFAMRREIEHLKEAVVMLGLTHIRNWASMLVLAQTADKPFALTQLTLERAKMCELIAKALSYSPAENYFTVGLLSTLDAFFNLPMSQILLKLPLHSSLSQALLKYSGQHGKILEMVIHFQQGEWAKLDTTRLPMAELTQIHLESINWIETLNATLTA